MFRLIRIVILLGLLVSGRSIDLVPLADAMNSLKAQMDERSRSAQAAVADTSGDSAPEIASILFIEPRHSGQKEDRLSHGHRSVGSSITFKDPLSGSGALSNISRD